MEVSEFWPLVAALGLVIIALLSRRLHDSPITMPMLCIAVGLVLYYFGGVPFDLMDAELQIVAEVTLAVVLFADAAMLKAARVSSRPGWPLRLLTIGGTLSLVLGALILTFVFPALPFWQVALIAALLTPTDAALGQAILSNDKVPVHLRDTLTAESGLNDGLALPAIIFLACAAVGFDHDLEQSNWWIFGVQQIGVGIVTGAVVGAGGGWLSKVCIEEGLANKETSAIVALLLVAICYFMAEELGGNAFVSVFIGGLFFGLFAKDCAEQANEFLETEGQLLLMIAFLFVGAIILPKGLAHLDWRIAVAVGLSLFLIRPLAIWLAMIGSGASLRSKIFLGWFGPRGLATALFTLLVLGEFSEKLNSDVIWGVAAFAVLASTVLHGVSAHWADRLSGSED